MPHDSLDSVAELQGYYGTLSIAEKVVQHIWQTLDFETDHLSTKDGKSLIIHRNGVLNKLEGADFSAAKIEIAGKVLEGDVEIHLYAADWVRHGHVRDRNYDHVVLHVTLFDSDMVSGEPRNRLVLLPYLKDDLESILTQYLLESSNLSENAYDSWVLKFLAIPSLEEKSELLLQKAQLRWDQKMRYARCRIDKYGWRQSCHQYLMEVLGYRRNRIPMNELALKHPLSPEFIDCDPTVLYESQAGKWKLRGCRPRNHPLGRLESYSRLIQSNPNWPDSLLELSLEFLSQYGSDEFSGSLSGMQSMRRELGIAHILEFIQEEVCMDEIGGMRIHTLICDAFLPLLAANEELDLFSHWYLWKPGDCPVQFDRAISASELLKPHGSLKCNGWLQGLLQLGLESG